MFFLSTPEFKTHTSSKGSIFLNLKYFFAVTLFGSVLILLSMFYWDQRVTYYFEKDDFKWLFARTITDVGLFAPYFISALIVFSILNIHSKFPLFRPKPWFSTAQQASKYLMIGLLYSGFWTHLIKFLVGRQRPKISPSFEPFVFFPFNSNWDFQSFGSGHSQVLFTVATFFSFYFPKNKYTIYLIAFLFTLTRAATRDHFLSDVFMGCWVGHVSTATLLLYLHDKKISSIKKHV